MKKMMQLSLSARPRTLTQVVGQKKIVAAIRKHLASDRVVKAWLFGGPKGTGKTTLSRILALAYECTHAVQPGDPCKQCFLERSKFQIHEVNASDVTGIDDLRKELAGADYGAMGDGRFRVYLIDEVHGLSDKAQNLLLKYLEDTPQTTVFILCSTAPQKIIETLRSRCLCYELREADENEARIYVQRLLRFTQSALPYEPLVTALVERRVFSYRLIAQAVEKYLSGAEPDDAVQVEGSTEVDIKHLTRAVIKGDWPETAKLLQTAEGLDVRAVRVALIAYLRTILLESSEIGDRAKTVATAISRLASLQNAEDKVVSAGLAAELYHLAALFSRYKF